MDFEKLPVKDLSPASVRPQALNAETLVDVINRGHATLVRKFDGFDYKLVPHTEGLMRMPYGAALHFQKHSTVPGTRDAESGVEQSYIGIVRNTSTGEAIDPPAFCTPFTIEECQRHGQKIEALARAADEPVLAVDVAAATVAGRVPIGRQQSGGRRRLQRETKGDVDMSAPDGPNDAQQEIEQTEAELADA